MVSNSLTIPIIHFNDVYNMTRSRARPGGSCVFDKEGKLHDDINHVVRFAGKIQEIRDKCATEKKDCLVLFSGDLFSASVESLLTRGSCMLHLMNEIAPDACVPGNHEFDYSGERFNQLVEFCNFPWVLSNGEEVTNDKNGVTLKGLHKHVVSEVEIGGQKLKIGIIGLMSDDTHAKIDVDAASTFRLSDMKESCLKLAAELRGAPHRCDLVIALTHALYKEDIPLAKSVNCYTEAGFKEHSGRDGELQDQEGVDLILGGHNHEYFVGDGLVLKETTGPEKEPYDPGLDHKGLLILKSGTDFEDLSQLSITVEDRDNGEVRKKVITSVEVTRHRYPGPTTQGQTVEASSLRKSRMSNILSRILKNEVMTNMELPLARLSDDAPDDILVNHDQATRRGETVLGNWIADSVIRWYEKYWTHDVEKLPNLIFLMTGGSIRDGAKVNSKKVLQGDIIRLLPFGTPLVTLTMTGKDLKGVFEDAFGQTGYQDSDSMKHEKTGAFPVVSGIKIRWNSKNPKGERVISMELLSGGEKVHMDDQHHYNVLTHTYLSNGGDRLETFKSYSKSVYRSEVPIYQALLKVIEGTSVDDAKATIQKIRESDTSSTSKSLEDQIQGIPPALLLSLPFGPLLQFFVSVTKAAKQPVLNIPRDIDGRIVDEAL